MKKDTVRILKTLTCHVQAREGDERKHESEYDRTYEIARTIWLAVNAIGHYLGQLRPKRVK